MIEIVKRCLLLGLIIMSVAMTGCGRKEPPQVEDAQEVREDKGEKDTVASKNGVDHRILSFNLEGMTEKGEKKWEVIGRTARSISENEIRLGNIVARTYGDQEAIITADQGVYDKAKNNVRLEQNVKATIENAGSIVKDQIGFPIGASDGSERDPSKKKKKIIITCDGEVEFDYTKNLAYFKDNVKVKSEDGDIDADKITVNLDPTTRKINDIVAEGHVKITQKESVAYSDSAKYKESDKTVSLKGNPKIVITQEGEGFLKEKTLER